MTLLQPNGKKHPTKLLAARTTRIQVAVASTAILVLGAWLAPPADRKALSPPDERAAPLLEQQVQGRETGQPFRGVQEAASRVRDQIVTVDVADAARVTARSDFVQPGADSPSVGSGVFVDNTHVLTHASALSGRSSASLRTADGRSLRGQVVAYEPGNELVLLETEPQDSTRPVLSDEPPVAGMLAVAVGRRNGHDLAVPVFITGVGTDAYSVGAVADSTPVTMPVYTLDGKLLALLTGDAARRLAYPVSEPLARLLARASSGDRLGSFGVAFQDLTGLLQDVFGKRGVLVSEVVEDGPAGLAGLVAGDVLLSIGDVDVSSAEQAARLSSSTPAGTETTFTVLSNRRTRTVRLAPAPVFEVAAIARAFRDAAQHAPEARVLFQPRMLDRAGIPPRARVISINGRSVPSRAQAARELRLPSPARILLRDGNVQFFAAIERTP